MSIIESLLISFDQTLYAGIFAIIKSKELPLLIRPFAIPVLFFTTIGLSIADAMWEGTPAPIKNAIIITNSFLMEARASITNTAIPAETFSREKSLDGFSELFSNRYYLSIT